MTLHEYVAAFCPDGARQLRRLIHERTGVQLPYTRVWRWCNPNKPCSLSVENAALVHAATEGACSMLELQTFRKLVKSEQAAGKARKRRTAARRQPRKRATKRKH